MSVIGIICEFNPFHNGHKYLIDSVKKDGDTVVCVMSGNFVQRGEPAIFDKRCRAKTALLCGADLVLELPAACSVSGAQVFARGGVKLLDSLGVVDTLAFGSECGDLEKLVSAADALEDSGVHDEIYSSMQTGITYAAARENAVRKIFGEKTADVLHGSNDILAVEYIGALKLLHSKIKPYAVLRKGAMHDGPYAVLRKDAMHDGGAFEGDFASGSLLREKIMNKEDISIFMPREVFSVIEGALKEGVAPSDYKKLDVAVLAFLRKAVPETFSGVPDVSEGIENRIINAAQIASALCEVFDNAKTKRYTHARIRRIVLCAFLGIKNSDVACGMPYIRILGFSKKGEELLHSIKKSASLPIVTRACDSSNLTDIGKNALKLESRVTDIYNLTLPKIRPCGTDMTDGPVKIQ